MRPFAFPNDRESTLKPIHKLKTGLLCPALTVLAASVLTACGGGGGSGFAFLPPGDGSGNAVTLSGVVAASGYVPGSNTGNPTLKAGYYAKATVFVDANGNGVLDSGEVSTTTDASGKFTLTTTTQTGQLVADIGSSATNTATGAKVASHLILRASADQIADQGAAKIVISPLSSEAQRLVEANGSSYKAEKANLLARLNVPTFNLGTAALTDPLADVNGLKGTDQYAALYQDNELTNRYTYATAKLDRKDMFPDHLAVAGGDPRLVGLSGVTLSNKDGSSVARSQPLQKQAPITFAQAQQAAFNVEGVPAYDNIFVIIEENKSTDVIVDNPRAVNINYILKKYNQLSTYYSTGNPSEPNYSALGGGDDFGITDDNWFGCGVVPDGPYKITDVEFKGGTASDGQPLPTQDKLPPANSATRAGYSTTAGAACSDTPTTGTVHNIPGDNLFTLMSKTGRTIRTYSESMNPGQDVRADSIADAKVAATYDATKLGVTNLDGSTPSLKGSDNYAVGNGLYKVKHGPSIAFQDARNLPEFVATNRTIFGTQYQEADWLKTSVYGIPSGWIYDQFSKDLETGDVGNINFVVPDQCDDMHGVGQDTSCVSANNGQANGVQRADIYLGMVVKKIQNSALWKNPNKRVAIVVMYDEGEGGSNGSCCGWNAGGPNSKTTPLTVDASGKGLPIAPPLNYSNGNFGHGNSIFGIISNQQDLGNAKKQVVDSDAYSHFSFVRTLQDMFQIADPAVDASYLNRAKYTEAFITANIAALPEYSGSADTHFDSVRPINHAYVIPSGYTQKLYPGDIVGVKDPVTGQTVGQITPQVGPDASQVNVWATK